MNETEKQKKERITKVGKEYMMFFYNELGYRIAEDDEEFYALGLAVDKIKSEGRKEALERIKFKGSYADGYWICSCGVAVSPTPENINEHITEHLKGDSK